VERRIDGRVEFSYLEFLEFQTKEEFDKFRVLPEVSDADLAKYRRDPDLLAEMLQAEDMEG